MERKNIPLNVKNRNIGIELLRFLLCLWIVIFHCSIIKQEYKKYFNRGFHVPTFFMLSFYFYYPMTLKRAINKIKTRFQRLLLPYIIWPILAIIFDCCLKLFASIGIYDHYISFKEYVFQILTGSQFYKIFYFHFNLMFVALILTIISFIFKNKIIMIFEFLGVISLYFHFSGLYKNIFQSHRTNIRLSVGCLIESFPSALIGFFYSSINLISKIENFKTSSQIVLLLLLYLIFKYDIFIEYEGFMYPNIFLNIFASTILIVLFCSIKFKETKRINKILEYITKYTGGIYYSHPLISRIFFFFFKIKKTYYSFSFIYIISYFICFFGNKLFIKSEFKYLFI